MPPRTQHRSPGTDVAALLGDELRELRKAAVRRTQDDVAAILGTDRSVLGKAETGDQPPTPDILTGLLDLYEVTGRLRRVYERMALVARARQDPGRARVTPWYEGEARAHTLRYWNPTIVPGIAQKPDYAAELYRAMGYSEDEVTEYVSRRMARQEVFAREDPPDTTILLWEPVLLHQIGTPAVMAGQLSGLLALPGSIVIQLVPGSLGANEALGSAINLAATEDAPELLLSDGLVEDEVTSDPVRVRRASATFNRVRGEALTVTESRDRLTKAMEKWQS